MKSNVTSHEQDMTNTYRIQAFYNHKQPEVASIMKHNFCWFFTHFVVVIVLFCRKAIEPTMMGNNREKVGCSSRTYT